RLRFATLAFRLAGAFLAGAAFFFGFLSALGLAPDRRLAIGAAVRFRRAWPARRVATAAQRGSRSNQIGSPVRRTVPAWSVMVAQPSTRMSCATLAPDSEAIARAARKGAKRSVAVAGSSAKVARMG